MIVKLADNIISPLGVGTRENYEAVKAGRSALRSYPATDLLPTGYFASLIDDSVLEPLYASLGLGQESGYTVFEKRCIACAAAAIREAGIDPSSDRAIFIISTTKANVELLDGHADVGSGEKASADAESKVSADSLPGCHHSVGAGCADRARPDALPDRRTPASAALQVSRYFGNPNTSLVVSNACISGLAAQIEAMRLLDAGTYDYAIVIGADVVGRFVISGFQSLKALSTEQCRPFDAARCGLNLGEAAACIVYASSRIFPFQDTSEEGHEPFSAGRDSGKLWTSCSGAVCNDANHISGPSRTGEGSYRALVKTLGLEYRPWQPGTETGQDSPASAQAPADLSSASASLASPASAQAPAPPAAASAETSANPAAQPLLDDIAFVNVHGTSTLYNDEMESFALTRAGLQNTPVNTLKGYFGHTLGAAGVLETILSMAAVEDGTVLGTRGFENNGVSNPLKISPSHGKIEDGRHSFVKLLSGFGGCNAAMLFRLESMSPASTSCVTAEGVERNTLKTSNLCKIDAAKCSIDFQENADNHAVALHANLSRLHSVEITVDGVVLDGNKLQTEGAGAALLENIYRRYVGDWPKFFKMDPLARLGFLASELLLKAEANEQRGEGNMLLPISEQGPASSPAAAGAQHDCRLRETDPRAVILFNSSGSLADDLNYQKGIDGPDHLGSPSLFVYTLPNIVTGEIAIRNKYYSETSFYCIPQPDEALMEKIVSQSIPSGQSAIAGWCECSGENDFYAKMFILVS